MSSVKDVLYHMGGVPVLAGIPFGINSKAIFCAPYRAGSENGASDSHRGDTPRRAVKTLSQALSLAVEERNDVVFMLTSGESAAETSDDLSASLDWSKNQVHLIGVHGGTKYGQRARVQPLAAATGVTPLFNLTGSGCRVHGVHFFCGGDVTNLVAMQVTGNHNVVTDCHIAGGGSADLGGAANATSLKLDGGSENVFKNCVIGLDTIERDADFMGELWIDGGASRMWFEDCFFTTYLSADNQTVTINDSTAIDRTLMFKNCVFFAKSTNKAVAQTTVFSIPAISQGAILLVNSYAASDGGAVDWDASNRGIIWSNNVAAAAGAAGGIMTGQ
jgi:hypothetical protein